MTRVGTPSEKSGSIRVYTVFSPRATTAARWVVGRRGLNLRELAGVPTAMPSVRTEPANRSTPEDSTRRAPILEAVAAGFPADKFRLLLLTTGVAFAWGFIAGALEAAVIHGIEYPFSIPRVLYACASGLLMGGLSVLASWVASAALTILTAGRTPIPEFKLAAAHVVALMLPLTLAAVLWLHKDVLGLAVPAVSPKGLAYTAAFLLLAAAVAVAIFWPLARWMRTSRIAIRVSSQMAVLGGLFALIACTALVVELARQRFARSVPLEHPCVVLISVDSVRQDVWNDYLAQHASKELRQFADGSRRFHRAYTTWSHSLPSHASMLSGLYPYEHGATMDEIEPKAGGEKSIAAPLRDEVVAVPEHLSNSGFDTAAIIHNAWLGPPWGVDRGFNTFINSGEALRLGLFGPTFVTNVSIAGRFLYHADQHVFRQTHAGTRLLHDWIRHRDRSRPFFLFFHLMEMHVPTDPPAEARAKFSTGRFSELSGSRLRRQIESGEIGAEDMPAAIRHIYNLSLAMLFEIDRYLVSTIRALEDQGLLQDALVIITSDHGDDFYERAGVLDHYHVYESVGRVPLLLHVPGESKGADYENLVSLVDLAPTIYAFTGIQPPQRMSGLDLLDAGFPDRALEREVILHGTLPGGGVASAVVSDRFKLIVSPDGNRELYDLAEDSREAENIVAESEEIANSLWGELEKHFAAVPADGGEGISREDLPEDVVEKLKALGYLQ